MCLIRQEKEKGSHGGHGGRGVFGRGRTFLLSVNEIDTKRLING